MAQPTAAEKIAQAGLDGIQRVTADGVTTEAMPIDDQIKAAEYAKKNTAVSRNHLGLAFRTLKPGGCG